ncbi:MAG: 50S ribosomal protein L17 [Bacteroidia bacterium]|nr:50S ribosomal protein L17 [Bacteroidia bacterium]
MRHGNKVNHLGRKTAHRKSMLQNLACSLIEHKRIKTTLAKAKELRKFVEPIINRTKEDSTPNRRMTFDVLQNKEAVKELYGNVRFKISNRNGGYTRILKIGNRLGDNAELAVIELVDFNELAPGKTGAAQKKKSRRQKKTGTTTEKAAPVVVETPVVEEVVETPVVEEVVETPVVEEVVETPVAEEVVETPAAEEVESSDEEKKDEA